MVIYYRNLQATTLLILYQFRLRLVPLLKNTQEHNADQCHKPHVHGKLAPSTFNDFLNF
jgi:hypothetical protein